MTDKHTPGPWRTAPRANNMIDVLHSVKAAGAITMALCRVQARDSWVREAEANAALIAAAPVMLAALRLAAVALARSTQDGVRGDEYDIVSAAIATATGIGDV